MYAKHEIERLTGHWNYMPESLNQKSKHIFFCLVNSEKWHLIFPKSNKCSFLIRLFTIMIEILCLLSLVHLDRMCTTSVSRGRDVYRKSEFQISWSLVSQQDISCIHIHYFFINIFFLYSKNIKKIIISI